MVATNWRAYLKKHPKKSLSRLQSVEESQVKKMLADSLTPGQIRSLSTLLRLNGPRSLTNWLTTLEARRSLSQSRQSVQVTDGKRTWTMVVNAPAGTQLLGGKMQSNGVPEKSYSRQWIMMGLGGDLMWTSMPPLPRTSPFQ